MQFSYKNPTQIEFGQGQIVQLQTLIPKERKVLVLYGGGSIKRNGVYKQVSEALKEHQWCSFGGVEPNPTKEKLDEAIVFARDNDIEFVLAVGGGSVIDGAKYIANAYFYEGDGWDLLQGTYRATQALEIGVVLTLAATGSESNTGSVITKRATNEKRFFHSAFSYPKFSILDPDVLKSLDDRQLANGIIDAFVHTCEQYITQPHGALAQDYYAEGILRGLINLAHTYDKRDDLWYANLMWLANQALNGLIGLGVPQDWGTHFIGHELSGLYGIDHAQTLAVIQPNLLTIMAHEKKEKLLQMGRNVFQIEPSTPFEVIEKIKALYASLNVKLTLSAYTKDEALIEKVTSLLKEHGFTHFGDRGTIDQSIVEKILIKSM